jgi:all-trans-retinol 13,14-reductase
MAGQTYSKFTRAGEKFDAIVIGSGTGGLSVAALLARHGKKVLLLEQHYIIGGYTHFFQRRGYHWDVGLHYVGQVHIEGTLLNKVFRYLSKDKLQWAPLDDIYDRIVFGEQEYPFPRGRANLKAKLKEWFPAPEDQASIDAYFDLLDRVQHVGSGFWAEKALPPALAKVVGPLLRRKLLKFSAQTTLDVLRGITKNDRLIGVLTAQYGDYGLLPSRSSFYMHALLANHYMEGAGYPIGGATQLAETMVPVIEEAGGAAVFRAEVVKILVEGNRAVGVEMADGKKILAEKVISDAGVVNTFTNLLPADVAERHGLRALLQQLTPSASHVGLYVGVKEAPQALNLPSCNYWIFPDEYDHQKNINNYTGFDSTIPVAFASFPAAKDPASQEKTPGRTTAEVIILVPFGWFQQWESLAWKKRGDEYAELKKKLADQLFEQLYRVAPQLRGKVDYFEVSTPLSTRHFTKHPSGEIYGVEHTPERFRQTWLRVHTPVKNLFLTGQDVMVGSIGGGTMGGVLAASAILRKNLLWTIKRRVK